MGSTLSSSWQYIKDIFVKGGNYIGELASKIWNWTKENIPRGWNWLKNRIMDKLKNFWSYFCEASLRKACNWFLGKIMDQLIDQFGAKNSIVKFIVDIIKDYSMFS